MSDIELQLKAVSSRRAMFRHNSKPLEFESFGNCGEFAIIKTPAAVLIPSNSMELEISFCITGRN